MKPYETPMGRDIARAGRRYLFGRYILFPILVVATFLAAGAALAIAIAVLA